MLKIIKRQASDNIKYWPDLNITVSKHALDEVYIGVALNVSFLMYHVRRNNR